MFGLTATIINKIVAVLIVTILVMCALMAFQSKKIKVLSGDLAGARIELLQAHTQMALLSRSNKETVKALSEATKKLSDLQNRKEKIKQDIRRYVEDEKADAGTTTSNLYSSMWDAYCSSDRIYCASEQPTE